MVLVSIHDKKAERFGNPYTTENVAVADRDFALGCKDAKSPMALFPEDIELVALGSFDNRTGIIKAYDKPMIIAEAKQYVQKENKKNG